MLGLPMKPVKPPMKRDVKKPSEFLKATKDFVIENKLKVLKANMTKGNSDIKAILPDLTDNKR